MLLYNEHDTQTLVLSANQTEPITVFGSNKNAEFCLVSVHSQIHNITLTYDDPTRQRFIKRNRKISGTNVGLVAFFDGSDYPKRSYLYLRNEHNRTIKVLVLIAQFDGYYPVPGGCNLEFPVNISPFLRLRTAELNSTLEFQKASLGANFRITRDKVDCDFSNNKLTYEVYSYYLKENDYSEHEYFRALKRMSSVDMIRAYGTRLEGQVTGQPKTRLKVLAYRGKGVVYAVVATFLNFQIAYAPVVSYDCDLSDSNSCRVYQSWLQIGYFLMLGLIGLVVCLDASKTEQLQVPYFGFICGSTAVYVLASHYPQINLLGAHATLLIGGLLFAGICLALWLKYPSTRLALALSGIPFGFLFVSLALSASVYQFQSSIAYGMLVTFGCSLIPVCSFFLANSQVRSSHNKQTSRSLMAFSILPPRKQLNSFCCSVFGSYLFVVAIEQFFGGSLVYVVLNTVNRLIYSDLYSAESNLPFQTVDYLSSALWFALVAVSLFLNLFTADSEIFLTASLWKSLKSFVSFEALASLFKKKRKVKAYEEIETVDNRDEDISKYNELSRSIIGSLSTLNKENEIGNTSFNSNSQYSSPLVKRKVNSSSTKIDFPSTPPLSNSRCSTPRRSNRSTSSRCSTPPMPRTPRPNQATTSTPITPTPNLLRNVVIQNAYSSGRNIRF